MKKAQYAVFTTEEIEHYPAGWSYFDSIKDAIDDHGDNVKIFKVTGFKLLGQYVLEVKPRKLRKNELLTNS